MKSFKVIPVLKSRFLKIERHYNNLLEDFGEEEIHEFRLNLKKLNAFLHLLNAGFTPRPNLQISRWLHRFYHRVGKLRNLQLHSDFIPCLCSQLHLAKPDNYLQVLREKQNEIKNEVRAMALKSSTHKAGRKLMEKAPEVVSSETIGNFVSENNQQLVKILLANTYTDRNLHNIRKLLKDFLYLWPWLEVEAGSLSNTPCADKGTCVAFCDMLGKFQNICVTNYLLAFYGSGNRFNTGEVAIVAALRQHVQREKRQLKNKLVTELRFSARKMEKEIFAYV